MKIGDLIRYRQSLGGWTYASGIVVELRKGPGFHRAVCFWPDGRITKPAVNRLEVINENR